MSQRKPRPRRPGRSLSRPDRVKRGGRVVIFRTLCEAPPRLGDDGNFLGYDGVGRDVTDAVAPQLNQAADAVQRGVGHRTGGVAFFAHIGGLVVGFITVMIWRKRLPYM